jgi:hypothetical protein
MLNLKLPRNAAAAADAASAGFADLGQPRRVKGDIVAQGARGEGGGHTHILRLELTTRIDTNCH